MQSLWDIDLQVARYYFFFLEEDKSWTARLQATGFALKVLYTILPDEYTEPLFNFLVEHAGRMLGPALNGGDISMLDSMVGFDDYEILTDLGVDSVIMDGIGMMGGLFSLVSGLNKCCNAVNDSEIPSEMEQKLGEAIKRLEMQTDMIRKVQKNSRL